MNVFEDLIEELKEENLLEETVIDTSSRENAFQPLSAGERGSMPFLRSVAEKTVGAAGIEGTDDVSDLPAGRELNSASVATDPLQSETPGSGSSDYSSSVPDLLERALFETQIQAPGFDPGTVSEEPAFEASMPVFQTPPAEVLMPEIPVPAPVAPAMQMPANLAPPAGRTSFAANPRSSFGSADKRVIVNHKEYFKKRAIDEVTGLQMVDYVLSGVEREQMKLAPKQFDDIPVKKALHDFMQVTGDTRSPEHARAEFQLMQETESWYSSLSHRDRHVSVAHLRRYCETTKPALSPQALIAMGRFYRNSPFSEQVRNKFDLIVTRLFSSEADDQKRELLFPRDELIAQVKDLYADWSSIQVYTAADDDSDLLIAVLKFQDFISEAEATATFDEMIGSDFFNRLRLFKEGCQENFFAPLLAVASIEANIRIGNRYVDLITKERHGTNAAALEEKYGFLHDQAISDSTGKSFYLVELLQERAVQSRDSELVEVRVNASDEPKPKRAKAKNTGRWAVNKWLLGFTAFVILGCGGIYFWAESKAQELSVTQSAKVKKVNLENSSLKEYLQSARINEETFYGVTLNSWTDLTLEKKEELLNKVLSIGGEKGFKRVHLLNEKGRSVGYASNEKVEVYNP